MRTVALLMEAQKRLSLQASQNSGVTNSSPLVDEDHNNQQVGVTEISENQHYTQKPYWPDTRLGNRQYIQDESKY